MDINGDGKNDITDFRLILMLLTTENQCLKRLNKYIVITQEIFDRILLVDKHYEAGFPPICAVVIDKE